MISKILSISPKKVLNILDKFYLDLFSKPEWLQVKKGHCKGIWLYVNTKKNTIFKDMIDGNYDSFLYSNSKLLKGKIIWDIGSHIGYHTLGYAKAVGDTGKVIAFEPNKSNIVRMKKNINRNIQYSKNIEIINVALSDKKSNIKFITTDEIDSGKSSGGHVSSSTPPMSKSIYSKFNREIIRSETIDNIVKTNRSIIPNILKIDVEGHEGNVLKGAKLTLKKYKPSIFMEVHHVSAMLEIAKTLIPLGYSINITNNSETSASRCFVKAEYEK